MWKELNCYKKIQIKQIDPCSCVAAGYEWLIRYAEYRNVDFDSFQDKFNLHKERKNTFLDVSRRIMDKYKNIEIKTKDHFKNGKEKLEFIKNKIKEGIPCLISKLNLGNYHIMPVVAFNDDESLIRLDNYGKYEIMAYDEIIKLHDSNHCCDISWI